MHRPIRLTVLSWLLAMAIGAAVPAIAGAAPDDFVTGAGQVDFGTLGTVRFSGHGTPTDAHGMMRIDIPGLTGEVEGSIDCVNVQGNRANISGALAEPPVGLPTVEYFVLSVIDRGPPSANDPMPDALGGVFSFAPEDCATFPLSAGAPFTRGNATVKDLTP